MTKAERDYIRAARDRIRRERDNLAEAAEVELKVREAERGRERRARAREGQTILPHNRDKTHCNHGHPFDHANTYVDSHGHRNCRACRRQYGLMYQREYRRRMKQAA